MVVKGLRNRRCYIIIILIIYVQRRKQRSRKIGARTSEKALHDHGLSPCIAKFKSYYGPMAAHKLAQWLSKSKEEKFLCDSFTKLRDRGHGGPKKDSVQWRDRGCSQGYGPDKGPRTRYFFLFSWRWYKTSSYQMPSRKELITQTGAYSQEKGVTNSSWF